MPDPTRQQIVAKVLTEGERRNVLGRRPEWCERTAAEVVKALDAAGEFRDDGDLVRSLVRCHEQAHERYVGLASAVLRAIAEGAGSSTVVDLVDAYLDGSDEQDPQLWDLVTTARAAAGMGR